MAILQITPITIGAVGVTPREWRILTDDTFAQVTTTGYLTSLQSTNNFQDTDYAIVYTTDLLDIMLNITVSSSGVVSLVNTSDSSVITYPVNQNRIAVFTESSSSSSTIGDDAPVAVNGGDIQAGLNGVSGKLRSYSSTSARGFLEIFSTANTGAFNLGITNAAMGQTSLISIPDPVSATANFMLNTGTSTMAAGSRIILAKVNGTESSNSVTASGVSGVITTSALTTAAGSSYAITWTNTAITATSVVTVTFSGGTNTRQNFRASVVPGAGTATLTIFNNEAVNALNGTILISYAVW
jgi:hypothetical protein